MSVETFYRSSCDEVRSDLRDLDRVAITVAVVSDDGDTIPAGTEGTIVAVWRDGAGFEIEFADPPGALATVEQEQVRFVARAVS